MRGITEAAHGALDYGELAERGLCPDEVLDFSANLNPFAPLPAVKDAIRHVDVSAYPDRDNTALRYALAEYLSWDAEGILAGNGSTELIGFAALSYLRPSDKVVVVGPTFGEYERAARIMGAEVYHWAASSAEGFEPEAAEELIRRIQPRMAFVCRPNNPTGQTVSARTLAKWLRAAPQTLFVIDEAYLELSNQAESALTLNALNALVLRSMTKAFGLAGLRLGYAVGLSEVIGVLRRVRPPWSVNAMAEAAGQAVLRNIKRGETLTARWRAESQRLRGALHELGLSPLPSDVPFFLLPVGDAALVREQLLARRINVRDCTSFGLPEYIRISPRGSEDNQKLIAGLRETVL